MLTREDSVKIMGKRFPQDFIARVDKHLECRTTDRPDDPDDVRQKKESVRKAMIEYRSKLNPLSSYNYQIKNPEYHKARALTLEMLPVFLTSAGMSLREFLEAGLIANEEIEDESNPAWKHLQWPDGRSADLAAMLDSFDGQTQKRVSSLFDAIEPECFRGFINILKTQPSDEYGKDDCFLPVYYKENPDEYTPEMKYRNMGNRFVETVNYLNLSNWQDSGSKALAKQGIYYLPKRVIRARHYWITFDLGELDRICEVLKLSPHWVFSPDSGMPVLGRTEFTDNLMDRYLLYDSQTKEILYDYVVMLSREGRK